jgi:tol-pal system protein YbgF
VGELEPVQRFAQKSDPPSDLLVQAPALKEVGVDTQTAAPSSIQAAVGGSVPDVAPKDPAAAVAESPRETIKLNPRDQYDAVLAKFKQGDLEGAQRGFTDFLSRYPTSDLAPNAQYWLGECYYGKRDYRRAIEAFDLVKHVYPRSEKVPAALLKQSLAYIEVNERKRATVLLQEILESYPKSPEAGRAEAKLAQLGRKR